MYYDKSDRDFCVVQVFFFLAPFARSNVESYYIFRNNVFQTQGMVVFHLYFYDT